MKTLIRQQEAEYVPAEWDGVNRSGIRVTGKTVLVLMDVASGQSSGSLGGAGVKLPDGYVERMTLQSISGVLVAVSDGAFCVNEDGSAWTGEKPKPGDRVNVMQYAGRQLPGRDGKAYRLMDYGCIGGIYETDADYALNIAAAEHKLGIEAKPIEFNPEDVRAAMIQHTSSSHEWDGDDLRCKYCRVKFVDVVDGKASRECAGEPQQISGAARAA